MPRTYRFAGWKFSKCVNTKLPDEECGAWIDEVNRHISEIGFEQIPED